MYNKKYSKIGENDPKQPQTTPRIFSWMTPNLYMKNSRGNHLHHFHPNKKDGFWVPGTPLKTDGWIGLWDPFQMA